MNRAIRRKEERKASKKQEWKNVLIGKIEYVGWNDDFQEKLINHPALIKRLAK